MAKKEKMDGGGGGGGGRARAVRKGFTLIEILIVVSIIAILSSVVLVGLGPTQRTGRDARRLSDLRQAQNGLELYFSKCGYYPGAASTGACGAFSTVSTWALMSAALTGSNLGVSTIPKDPTAGHSYYYAADSTGSSYMIAAKLEDGNNAAFNGYVAPSLTSPTTYTFGDTGAPASCDSPTYCVQL